MYRRRVIQTLPSVVRNRVIEAAAAVRQLQGTPSYDNPGAYWIAPPDKGNIPESYAESDVDWDVNFMLVTVGELLPSGGTVLEFGCNAGRILHRFARSGQYKTIGVEFNPSAVELGKARFPELKSTQFLIGDGAEVLSFLPDSSVEVSYTSHALRHVSPASIQVIARELSRVTTRCIITSEDEGSRNHLNFPRNYRRLFGALGWREVAKHYAMDLGDGGEISMTSVLRVLHR